MTESKTDEILCPHCGGSGTTGLGRTPCVYCKGERLVSYEMAEQYDENTIGELSCPRCRGSGTAGLIKSVCKLCDGSGKVTRDVYEEYLQIAWFKLLLH